MQQIKVNSKAREEMIDITRDVEKILTANGAWARTGDLYASGTVSGPEPGQVGSFIERTWNGTQPVRLDDGTSRSFLLDGDTVTIGATAPGPGGSVVAFGEVSGTVVKSG